MMSSAVRLWPTTAWRLACSELASTPTPVTSAMPTISAAAVTAVRRGLRAALRRPSLPGVDQANTRPSSATAGRAIAGVSMATPTKVSSTPPSSAGRVPSPRSPNSATPTAATPSRAGTVPVTVRAVSGRSGVAASRSAAIGGTREARSAGSSAATTVTSTPTRYDAATAAAGRVSLASGNRSPLWASITACRPTATPRPATRPRVAASSPTTTAAASAQRPQQRQLRGALGDQDREGVEDQEGPDEQRDGGEAEQEGADEAQEPFHVAGLVGGDLLAGA